MIPLRASDERRGLPIVTWTIIALCIIIYLWDRQGHLFGPEVVFVDLAMQPRLVVHALALHGSLISLVTVFTSLFLHANLMHIGFNMLFLFVFGPGVEAAIGTSRYALYYFLWGVVAAASQIWVDPMSLVPTLGASGAIGGVMGAYLVLHPTKKIEVVSAILPIFAFDVSAWVMLLVWFAFQILFPPPGVANWAHVGGFLAGMVTVLILRGRREIQREARAGNP